MCTIFIRFFIPIFFFKVDEVVTDPWAFNAIDLDLGIPSSTIPIIDYGGSPTKFERINGFLQDSID